MAGYGSEITAPTKFDSLIAVLLRAAQRRAQKINSLRGPRDRRLRMRYRRLPPQGDKRRWVIEIDGAWWEIAVWSQWIERDLPVVAEGYTNSMSANQTVRIAKSLVARWHNLIVPKNERKSKPFTLRTKSPDENAFQWTILNWPEDEDLRQRLLISDEMLARWYVGDLSEEIVLEESHRILEYLARRITKSGHSVRFPKLVERMYDKGYIEETEKKLFIEFNKIRKEFRHRDRVIQSETERNQLRDLIERVMFAIVSLYDKYADMKSI